MWSQLRTVERTPPLSFMPLEVDLYVRTAQAGEVRAVLDVQDDGDLEPGESVHHLNGIRDDNRPENLELWTRPQPSGIHVSDAIAWAREILERYGERGPDTPPTVLTSARALLEVPGVEPGSSVSSAGLLRAQPVGVVGPPPSTGAIRRPQPQ